MATTTTTTTPKVTNAAMMAVTVALMENVPQDAFQTVVTAVLGDGYKAADVVSKARAHRVAVEKSGAKASGPSKAAVENTAYAGRLAAAWEGDPATPKEVANASWALKALNMAACSSQKMSAILAAGINANLFRKEFDGKGTFFYSPVSADAE